MLVLVASASSALLMKRRIYEKKGAPCASQKQGHTSRHRTPARLVGFKKKKEMDEPEGVIFFPRKCASSRVLVAVTRKKTEHSTEGPGEAYAVSPHGRQLHSWIVKTRLTHRVICFGFLRDPASRETKTRERVPRESSQAFVRTGYNVTF